MEDEEDGNTSGGDGKGTDSDASVSSSPSATSSSEVDSLEDASSGLELVEEESAG